MQSAPTRRYKIPYKGMATLFGAVAIFAASTFVLHPQGQSANLTSASITLSNSRLSFLARLAAGNTTGSSIITIKTTGTSTYTSESTAQIRADDTVVVGANSYTVADTEPDAVFRTTAGLTAGDADENDVAYSAQSTNLSVRFETATAIANGSFRVLVPAAATGDTDGIPDPGFFDYSAGIPTVTCPTDGGGYTFAAGSAQNSTSAAISINGVDYHAFTCSYTGTGGVASDFTANPMVISGLINPAPSAAGRTNGVADSHTLIIQHLDSGSTVQDTTSVAVGVIEAVKITATVDPTINFTIAGVAASTSKCGATTDVTTTAVEVPFGVLDLANFVDAAQTLTVSTNASNGYAVTAIANDQLGLNGQTCTADDIGNVNCIQDARGDTPSMSHTSEDEWNTPASSKGFGYSLNVIGGTYGTPTTPFAYNSVSGGCSGTFCARHFADAENSQSAVNIMTDTTVADSHQIDVCYRIIPAVTNAAGDYQNSVTYTATATF